MHKWILMYLFVYAVQQAIPVITFLRDSHEATNSCVPRDAGIRGYFFFCCTACTNKALTGHLWHRKNIAMLIVKRQKSKMKVSLFTSQDCYGKIVINNLFAGRQE